MDPGYLPKEKDSVLNKTILRTLWNNKLIVSALGVKNENEAREWFRAHPKVHHEFELMNMELQVKIEELQKRANIGLRQIVDSERKEFVAFMSRDVEMTIKKEPDF